jgi:hypothetical protein
MNSPATNSLRELEPARIFPASSGVVHPKRRHWKWRGWLRGDMVEITTDVRGRIARMQEEKKAPGAEGKSQKCE